MTLLLPKHPEATPPTDATLPAGGQEQPVISMACKTCGAAMRAEQDWCLECGSAASGRPAARPGWRAPVSVVGLTLLLLVGAVAASYAALTGDAQRAASRPSAGSGAPIVAQPPGTGAKAVVPGATGPGTTAPPAAQHPAAPAQPQPAASKAPAPPSSGAGGSPSSSGGSPSSSGGAGSPSSASKTIKLAAGAATTYDPSKRAGAEFGPAGNAVDASLGSVWDVTVPADGDPIGAGLVLDLGAPYKLESLKIDTPTGGFGVELYGAAGKKAPPDVLDDRWDRLGVRSDYADGSSIQLKGRAGGKLRYVGLWFTDAAHADDPRIAIANITVTGTR